MAKNNGSSLEVVLRGDLLEESEHSLNSRFRFKKWHISAVSINPLEKFCNIINEIGLVKAKRFSGM